MAITLLSRMPLPGTVSAVVRPDKVSSKPNKERSKSLWEVQGAHYLTNFHEIPA
jgi:hypothetical protein